MKNCRMVAARLTKELNRLTVACWSGINDPARHHLRCIAQKWTIHRRTISYSLEIWLTSTNRPGAGINLIIYYTLSNGLQHLVKKMLDIASASIPLDCPDEIVSART